jgi:hypothetical protein
MLDRTPILDRRLGDAVAACPLARGDIPARAPRKLRRKPGPEVRLNGASPLLADPPIGLLTRECPMALAPVSVPGVGPSAGTRRRRSALPLAGRWTTATIAAWPLVVGTVLAANVLLASGVGFNASARLLGRAPSTLARWRKRFDVAGLCGSMPLLTIAKN